ncbi:hypothetical protein B0T20DRAFT_390947 [Sordaria brevicollis]|uniref:Uncharacterized protein n=1 Tax=Sordaria brevicollis TaxID=83679 RepID=A0AAE0PJD1_SORBR|nr:hypothetical protein B0T20DRAFT_390947 [Sordaria brevicollis]
MRLEKEPPRLVCTIPPRTRAVEPTPPLLSFPLEIRNEIYRHTWTIPVNPKEHIKVPPVLRAEGEQIAWNSLFCLTDDYLKLQMGQLHTLAAVCQQVRAEVLSEYFSRTQVYIRFRLNPTYIERHLGIYGIEYAMERLRSSPLFTTHTQHVCLHWSFKGERDDLMESALDWLSEMKQLKTLELMITDSAVDLYWKDVNRSVEAALGSWGEHDHWEGFRQRSIWEEMPGFKKIKETLVEATVREDLRQLTHFQSLPNRSGEDID